MSLRAICDYQRIFAVRAARREDCLTADVPTSAAPKSSLCIDREARKTAQSCRSSTVSALRRSFRISAIRGDPQQFRRARGSFADKTAVHL